MNNFQFFSVFFGLVAILQMLIANNQLASRSKIEGMKRRMVGFHLLCCLFAILSLVI